MLDPFSFAYIYHEDAFQVTERDLSEINSIKTSKTFSNLFLSESTYLLRKYRENLNTISKIVKILLDDLPIKIVYNNEIKINDFSFDFRSLRKIFPNIGLNYPDEENFILISKYIDSLPIGFGYAENGIIFHNLTFEFKISPSSKMIDLLFQFNASINMTIKMNPKINNSQFLTVFAFHSANATIISTFNQECNVNQTQNLSSLLNLGMNYFFNRHFSENILGTDGIRLYDELLLFPNLKIFITNARNSQNIFLFNVKEK